MSTRKAEARERFAQVLADYERVLTDGHLEKQSEATARSWIERVLVAFGWDPADPREVVQEWTLRGRDALRKIKDPDVPNHDRPDYGLIAHRRPIAFLDAKRLGADLWEDDDVSFQVRSYGWSNGLRVSFAFNIEQFAVWDTRFMPKQPDDAARARVLFLKRSEYLKQFDVLWDHLGREALLLGSIYRLYPDNRRTPDMKPLDTDFEERLTRWRLAIAKSILKYGTDAHEDIASRPEVVSIATQRIIDRIVFLRFCESMGLEEYGTLGAFCDAEQGFWLHFAREHPRYRREYDGILFPSTNEADPTGVEAYINQWWLQGGFWKTIRPDLYQMGYRFETVPLELIGGMYERFLGKRLTIHGNTVKDDYKPEYQQTKGAIYTPPWVVQRVLDRTLGPLAQGRTPEQIFALRIVDPACGSGSFLLGTFDWLEARLLEWVRQNPADARVSTLAAAEGTGWRLLPATVRRIIDECLYGVDIDTEAVEVARMSLALRYLERAARDVVGEPKDLLKGIGRNIRQGNSLIGTDALKLGFDAEALARMRAFDWKSTTRGFGNVFEEQGGFDAVVGNPPYIEVKRYKEWLPDQYAFLKAKPPPFETAAEGKTDISVPFMEKGVQLLRPNGRLGYIVQNRFFKTDYGEVVRAWLTRDGLLEDLEDFRDLQIFEGRTTYTAIVTLSRQPNAKFRYRTYDTLEQARAGTATVDTRYPTKVATEGVWALDNPELLELHRSLAKRHGTIGDHKALSVGVGLQVLWSKGYMLDAIEVGPRVLRARAFNGQEYSFERAVVRPLCRNDGFHPFRSDNADKWVVFPYEIDAGEFREIGWKELVERFPRTAAYLKEVERAIKAATTVNEERDRWHLYTRPQNIVAQAQPKVLFPMTVEDVVASVDLAGDVYQDNVNVNAIYVTGNKVPLAAIAAVFNSTAFNALAKLKAGLNDGGWRKFNRQYADLVPFPLKRLNTTASARLVHLADEITKAQRTLVVDESDEGGREALRSLLEGLWRELDEAVEDLYDLSPDERRVVRKNPRRMDRVDLLLRQAGAPPEEAVDEPEAPRRKRR